MNANKSYSHHDYSFQELGVMHTKEREFCVPLHCRYISWTRSGSPCPIGGLRTRPAAPEEAAHKGAPPPVRSATETTGTRGGSRARLALPKLALGSRSELLIASPNGFPRITSLHERVVQAFLFFILIYGQFMLSGGKACRCEIRLVFWGDVFQCMCVFVCMGCVT